MICSLILLLLTRTVYQRVRLLAGSQGTLDYMLDFIRLIFLWFFHSRHPYFSTVGCVTGYGYGLFALDLFTEIKFGLETQCLCLLQPYTVVIMIKIGIQVFSQKLEFYM